MVGWLLIAFGAALFYSLVRQDRITNKAALRAAWRWYAVAIFGLAAYPIWMLLGLTELDPAVSLAASGASLLCLGKAYLGTPYSD